MHASKHWRAWSSRFEDFIAASGITDEMQKCKLLAYTGGRELAEVIKEHDKGASKSLGDLLKSLNGYFDARKNTVLSRYQFRQCAQQPGEAVDNWYTRMKAAADTCDYGELRDSIIQPSFATPPAGCDMLVGYPSPPTAARVRYLLGGSPPNCKGPRSTSDGHRAHQGGWHRCSQQTKRPTQPSTCRQVLRRSTAAIVPQDSQLLQMRGVRAQQL